MSGMKNQNKKIQNYTAIKYLKILEASNKMNKFSIDFEKQFRENGGHCDTEIKCIFQKGPWNNTEFLQHSLNDQQVKYTIKFSHDALTHGTAYPLTLTVFATTQSKDLSQENIKFVETKFLPLGTESSLEITLGNSYLHVSGWTITDLQGKYPSLEWIPRNNSYNTIINTNNFVPESILNLEPKPIIKKFDLKLSSGFAIESRSISVSTFIPKQIDIDTYIYNLSDRLLNFNLDVDPQIIPDSNLSFYINSESALEFKVSIIRNLGFLFMV